MRGMQMMFRIPPELHERLDRHAATEFEGNRSMVLRLALQEYLDRYGARSNEHLTDDDVLAGLSTLIEHGPHVMSAGEVIKRVKEMVV